MSPLAIAVLIGLANLGLGLAKIAPVLEVCSISDPKLPDCIIKVVEKIRPQIASGDYGDGRIAPMLDPYFIDKVDIEGGSGFKCYLRNVSIDGVVGFQIRKLRLDKPNRRFHINVKFPGLFVHGKYDLKMKILVLELAGKGNFNLTLNNTLANIKIQYYVNETDGKELLKFNPAELKFKFDKAKFYLKNLFNGDKTLEQVGNDAINSNPSILLEEVIPGIVEHLKKSLTKIANIVVDGSEINELLTP